MNPLKVGSIIVVAIVGLVCVSLFVLPHAQQAPQKAGRTVGGVLPGQVAKLALWPSVEQRIGKVIPADTSKWSLRARNNSVEWMQKVIDPRWLPENPEETLGRELVLLQHAYENLDTSHVEWQQHGYRFRVSQTKTVLYIEVTPMQGKISAGDVGARRKASRELAARLIKDVGEAEYGEKNIAPAGGKAVLMRVSFDAAIVEECDDGVAALPARIDMKDKLDSARSNFWWRLMGWWTNGQTLGLFTLKTEGGAWSADYGTSLDEQWLTPPPSRKSS